MHAGDTHEYEIESAGNADIMVKAEKAEHTGDTQEDEIESTCNIVI